MADQLLDELLSDATISDEVVCDLELRLAGVRMRQGDLDRAHMLLDSAGKHVPDPTRQRSLADQWQRLARARVSTGNRELAEAALRRAAEFGSAAAMAALAQHLQREQRYEEARTQ